MSMPSTTPRKPLSVAACFIALAPKSGASSDIQLFPSGVIKLPKGAMIGQGPWRLDESAAQAFIAASQQANDYLIDYEHQSLLAADNGQPVPAAGWINPASLVWRDDGLYAHNVRWNERAAALIASDEYRYLSPVFYYDDSGTPTRLISVALTNLPAIDGMARVTLAAAKLNPLTQETCMEPSELMQRLCRFLDLPATATPIEITAELDKLTTLLPTGDGVAATSLPKLIADKDQQIAALRSQAPDPAKYVPIEALLAIQQQQVKTNETEKTEKVAALIAAHPAIIVPALQPWATQLGLQDFARLEQYIANASPIAALTATQTQGQAPPDAKATLSAEQIAVCTQLGLTQDQFLAGRTV